MPLYESVFVVRQDVPSTQVETMAATFGDIVKFGVYVTDMAYLPTIREIRDRHVDRAAPPASTAIQVGALFRPGYLVEIDALAVVPDEAGDRSAESA